MTTEALLNPFCLARGQEGAFVTPQEGRDPARQVGKGLLLGRLSYASAGAQGRPRARLLRIVAWGGLKKGEFPWEDAVASFFVALDDGTFSVPVGEPVRFTGRWRVTR